VILNWVISKIGPLVHRIIEPSGHRILEKSM
jgi:hypothetical protein